MTSNPITTDQAIQNARQALRRGDKRTARRWAELAASLTPEMEEAWLILAEIANPRASLAYFEQALKINPRSRRASEGLRRAQQRYKRTQPQAARRPSAPPGGTTTRRHSSLPILILILAIPLAVGIFLTGVNSPTRAFIFTGMSAPAASMPPWAQVDIAKPTYTPSPTLTFTPTATSTPIPTFTPTLIPSDTPTPAPLPTEELAIYASGSTYIVRPGDTLFSIAMRFGIDPDDLAAVNGIRDPTSIYAGQQIAIPQGGYIAPIPAYTGGMRRILVDISEQHLYAYQGEVLVYSFVASTGMNNATRTGTFSVLNKLPNAYGETWNIWMPNWLGIYWAGGLQNGIHALPILPSGRRLWAGYLGRPISYGCVVLGVDEAQLLYDWTDIGTPVEIRW